MPIKLCQQCREQALPRKSRCDFHQRELERERSARRRERPAGDVYKRKLWLMRREQVLREQPICAICNDRLSEEVDHIVPLAEGGDPYRRDGLQGICKQCHSAKTAREHASRYKRL